MSAAAARVPRPVKMDLKDDPSMPIWRLKGTISLIMTLASSGPRGGLSLDLNSEEMCAFFDLLLLEVERLEACF